MGGRVAKRYFEVGANEDRKGKKPAREILVDLPIGDQEVKIKYLEAVRELFKWMTLAEATTEVG